MNTFIGNTSHQYVKNHSKTNSKPIPLGTFTNEKRWNKKPVVSPGVGDYDLTGFKSYAKASETTFLIPEK